MPLLKPALRGHKRGRRAGAQGTVSPQPTESAGAEAEAAGGQGMLVASELAFLVVSGQGQGPPGNGSVKGQVHATPPGKDRTRKPALVLDGIALAAAACKLVKLDEQQKRWRQGAGGRRQQQQQAGDGAAGVAALGSDGGSKPHRGPPPGYTTGGGTLATSLAQATCSLLQPSHPISPPLSHNPKLHPASSHPPSADAAFCSAATATATSPLAAPPPRLGADAAVGLAWALAKLQLAQPLPEEAVEGLLYAFVTQADKSDPKLHKQLSMATWAAARLGLRDRAVWARLWRLCASHAAALSPRQLAACLWGLAHQPGARAFVAGATGATAEAVAAEAEQAVLGAQDALLKAAAAAVDRMGAPDVSNLCWALPHLEWSAAASDLVPVLGQRVNELLPSLEPRQLATCLWGLGWRLSVQPTLQQEAAGQAMRILPAFQPPELVMLVYSLAKQVPHSGRAMFRGVLARLAPLLTSMAHAGQGQGQADEQQGSRQQAWGQQQEHTQEEQGPGHKASGQQSGHEQALLDRAKRQPGTQPEAQGQAHPNTQEVAHAGLPPHNAAVLLWAYGRAGGANRELLSALCAVVRDGAAELSAQGAAMALWGLAKMRYFDQAAFAAVCASLRASPERLARASPSSLSQLLWALASSRHALLPPPAQQHLRPLLRMLTPLVHSLVGRFQGRQLATVLWALASLGAYDADLFHGASGALLARSQLSGGARSAAQEVGEDGETAAAGGAQEKGPVRNEGEGDGGDGSGGRSRRAALRLGASRGGFRALRRRLGFTALMAQRLRAGSAGASRVSAQPLLRTLQPFELARVAWAFAKVQHTDERLFQGIRDRLVALLKGAARRRARAAAARAQDGPWGRHATDDRDPEALASVGGVAKRQAAGRKELEEEVLMPSVARCMWAFAMLGQYDEPLFRLLTAQAKILLPTAHPSDVSSILWALSSTGHPGSAALVQGCLLHAHQRLAHYAPSDLTEVLHAWAAMQQQGDDTELEADGLVIRSGGAVGGIGSTGAALVPPPVYALLSHLCGMLWSRPWAFSFGDLSKLASTLSSLGVSNDRVLAQSCSLAVPLLLRAPVAAATSASQASVPAAPSGPPGPVSDPSHVVSLLHALARLSPHDSGDGSSGSGCAAATAAVFDAAAPLLLRHLDEMPAEELVQAAWAYAVTLPQTAVASSTDSSAAVAAGDAGHERGGTGVALERRAAVLRGLSGMLAAAVPRGRPDVLTPIELRLLWQAHACAHSWWHAVGGGGGGSGTGGVGGVAIGDGHAEEQDGALTGQQGQVLLGCPLQVHSRLLEAGRQAILAGDASSASRSRRRLVAELLRLLEELGYHQASVSGAGAVLHGSTTSGTAGSTARGTATATTQKAWQQGWRWEQGHEDQNGGGGGLGGGGQSGAAGAEAASSRSHLPQAVGSTLLSDPECIALVGPAGERLALLLVDEGHWAEVRADLAAKAVEQQQLQQPSSGPAPVPATQLRGDVRAPAASPPLLLGERAVQVRLLRACGWGCVALLLQAWRQLGGRRQAQLQLLKRLLDQARPSRSKGTD